MKSIAQQVKNALPEGFNVSWQQNFFGNICWELWREEKDGNLIKNSFKLAEIENDVCKFVTYWRSALVSPECRYKKVDSPLYLTEVAKDYKVYLEAKKAKADLGL